MRPLRRVRIHVCRHEEGAHDVHGSGSQRSLRRVNAVAPSAHGGLPLAHALARLFGILARPASRCGVRSRRRGLGILLGRGRFDSASATGTLEDGFDRRPLRLCERTQVTYESVRGRRVELACIKATRTFE